MTVFALVTLLKNGLGDKALIYYLAFFLDCFKLLSCDLPSQHSLDNNQITLEPVDVLFLLVFELISLSLNGLLHILASSLNIRQHDFAKLVRFITAVDD